MKIGRRKINIRASEWKAGGGFVLFVIIFFASLLLGLDTLADGDFVDHYLPFSVFFHDELMAGRVPLWTPHTYSGQPFLADPQSAIFYPISTVLHFLTLPLTTVAARLYWLQVEVMVHVALAGFSTYLLVKDLTKNGKAALLSGILFAFSGYLTSYPLLQPTILRTAIWLPLLLWLIWRAIVVRRTLWWWMLAALTYAVAYLAGHPQTFIYLSYVVGIWILFLAVIYWRQHRPGRKWITHTLVAIILFYLVTLGLIAVQFLPSLEFIDFSVRADTDYNFVSSGFPIRDTWLIILPGVLTQFSPLYIGVIGLGLAIFAPTTALNPTSRVSDGNATPIPLRYIVVFFLALTFIALLLSYGRNGFLYPLFYRWAPGWDLFRNQERAAYIMSLGSSVLAGIGYTCVAYASVQLRRRFAITYLVLVTVSVVVFAVVWQIAGRSAVSDIEYLVISTVSLLGVVFLAAYLWPVNISHRYSLILIALAALNLFLVNANTTRSSLTLREMAETRPEIAALVKATNDCDIEAAPCALQQQGMPGRVYNEHRVDGAFGMVTGVEEVWGDSPLRLERYAQLFEEFPLDRMWQVTGVEHVLTWRRELFEPSVLLAEYPQETDTTYLHRLIEPNPRAWLAQNVVVADDAKALSLLADHQFDIQTNVLLSPGEALKVERPLIQSDSDDDADMVRIVRLSPNHLRIDVQTERDSLLVLSENWMPGWQATATQSNGGTFTPSVLRANLSFLGIPLPQGDFVVDVSYQPASVRLGALVSGLTLIVLLIYLISKGLVSSSSALGR